jgi:putative ABC transport system ATP-binding protein
MIKLSNVTKTYNINKPNEITPVEDLSFIVESGETVMIKGPSGSGKSTILSMVAAISKPTSGDIIIGEKHIAKLPENFSAQYRRETVGIVFQNYNLLENLNAIENVAVPLYPTKLKHKEIMDMAMESLSQLNMADKALSKVGNLSGGEQQRVAIARALVNKPEIVLADEPTANLDRKLADQFIEILKKLSSMKHTIIIATHDPLLLESDLNQRIIELSAGKET